MLSENNLYTKPAISYGIPYTPLEIRLQIKQRADCYGNNLQIYPEMYNPLRNIPIQNKKKTIMPDTRSPFPLCYNKGTFVV